MKRLIILMLLFSTATKAQDCIDFVTPKKTYEAYKLPKAYNPTDYHWVMVSEGKAPVMKTHYKAFLVADGYTEIDSVKSKQLGKLCTKFVEPKYVDVVDYIETLTPSIPPIFAYVKKQGIATDTFITKKKVNKDGYLTIKNCN